MPEFEYRPEDHGGILVHPKDPDNQTTYRFNYNDWLKLDEGEALMTAEALVSVGWELVGAASISGTVVNITMKGGTHGGLERLTCRVTTTATPVRIDDRTIIVPIKER